MDYEYPLTFLTPTYNRANYLPRLYRSILAQKNRDFQWLIIDDGSTDDTKDVVCSFSKSVHWEYYYKENGGKHTALNYAHSHIKGKLICIIDSDDWLTEDAVDVIFDYWEKYKDTRIKCLTFLKKKNNGDLASNGFPDEEVISNVIDFRINQRIKGDCCEVLLSDVFKEYQFPVFRNERFVPEGCLWNHVGFKYDTAYINRVIYLCEYLNDGLTNSGRLLRIKNPQGCAQHCLSFFESDSRNVNKRILFKEGVLYSCYSRFAGESRNEIFKRNSSFIIRLSYIPGLMLYCFWKGRYRKELMSKS